MHNFNFAFFVKLKPKTVVTIRLVSTSMGLIRDSMKSTRDFWSAATATCSQ